MTKHQVSCTVAGCAICGDHPMEMDITYADTSPPCPSCAVLQRKLADGSVMLNDQAQTIEALHARCEVLEEVVEWACVRLGIVNDPAYSGYTHDLCNEVIAELRRRAKEG